MLALSIRTRLLALSEKATTLAILEELKQLPRDTQTELMSPWFSEIAGGGKSEFEAIIAGLINAMGISK